MRNIIFYFLLFISFGSFAYDGHHRRNDTLHLFNKIDTTYIENYHDLLSVKLIGVVRTNKFSVTDNITQSKLEYSINTNANLGLGASIKGIGVEFQYNPPGLNNDDSKFGKSTQLSFATNANGRRFIYDVYYRYNQGYHTTTAFKVPGDTLGATEYIYRPDIKNTNLGAELVYVVNNKRFSSSAPYSLSQKQRKSAGSLLIGTFGSLYAIEADSVIFPDSVRNNFKPEVQFKSAGSITWGISCGYTYTLIFGRNWFVNIYTLPGLAMQQYYSTNAFNQQTHTNTSIGASLQSRFSIGYNRKNYFIGISWMNTTYFVDNDKMASLSYKNGVFRFYYGHRFDVRKILKKRL